MKKALKVAGKIGKYAVLFGTGYVVLKNVAYLFCSPNYKGDHPFGL